MGELELRDQVLVEALGPLGLGMDQQATAADGIAKAIAFMAFVDPQTSQQGDGLVRHDGRR